MKKIIFYLSTLIIISSCENTSNYNVIIGQKITTSSEHPDNKAISLVDSNETNNVWNSGKVGQDWIQIDFNKSFDIDTISFDLAALPSSVFYYDILLKREGEEFKNVLSSKKYVENIYQLSYANKFDNVNSIKIIVKNDSSYIALRDLKVIGH